MGSGCTADGVIDRMTWGLVLDWHQSQAEFIWPQLQTDQLTNTSSCLWCCIQKLCLQLGVLVLSCGRPPYNLAVGLCSMMGISILSWIGCLCFQATLLVWYVESVCCQWTAVHAGGLSAVTLHQGLAGCIVQASKVACCGVHTLNSQVGQSTLQAQCAVSPGTCTGRVLRQKLRSKAPLVGCSCEAV